MMTALAEELRRVGLAGSRLDSEISGILAEADGGGAKARERLRKRLYEDTELMDAACDALIALARQGMSGEGHSSCAEGANHLLPSARQQNGDGAGQVNAADSGPLSGARPSPERSSGEGHEPRAEEAITELPSAAATDAGAIEATPKGRPCPAPAPTAARVRGIAAAHKSAASSILDRFRITERNGAMTPIGDVKVDRLDSLIYYTGRRRWVADREHTLLCLIKEDVSKFPQVPAGADIRQLFKEQEIQRKIDLAAQMVRPIEGEKAQINA